MHNSLRGCAVSYLCHFTWSRKKYFLLHPVLYIVLRIPEPTDLPSQPHSDIGHGDWCDVTGRWNKEGPKWECDSFEEAHQIILAIWHRIRSQSSSAVARQQHLRAAQRLENTSGRRPVWNCQHRKTAKYERTKEVKWRTQTKKSRESSNSVKCGTFGGPSDVNRMFSA